MSSLLEYTIEKTKHGVRVMHNGKEVHKAKDTARAQQWLEDIVKEGVMGMPLKGHAYHAKSDEELRYIQQDAHQAADAMRDHNPTAEAKYLDQLNDAATILHYRSEGGKQQGKKMTENFMDATLAQNFIGAEIAFKQIMAEKAGQFMEQRKQEIAQTLAQESTVNESLRLLATHKSDDFGKRPAPAQKYNLISNQIFMDWHQ